MVVSIWAHIDSEWRLVIEHVSSSRVVFLYSRPRTYSYPSLSTRRESFRAKQWFSNCARSTTRGILAGPRGGRWPDDSGNLSRESKLQCNACQFSLVQKFENRCPKIISSSRADALNMTHPIQTVLFNGSIDHNIPLSFGCHDSLHFSVSLHRNGATYGLVMYGTVSMALYLWHFDHITTKD